MKTIIRFLLVGALPLALAAPAFAERGHGGEFHAGFRGGHQQVEQRGRNFHHFGGNFLPYSYYPYPDYSYVYPSPAYSPPEAVEQPPAVSEESPVQREVAFPNGKYVLQGDGVTDAYHWVWIPTVPEMPPAPPTAPPASKPVPSDSTVSRSPQRLYRWIDTQGVVNWTNNWEAVPERHRSQAKRFL